MGYFIDSSKVSISHQNFQISKYTQRVSFSSNVFLETKATSDTITPIFQTIDLHGSIIISTSSFSKW